MSLDYDHYLTQHFRRIAAPSTLQWNAVAAVKHHGKFFPPDKTASILEIGPGFGNLLALLHNSCGYENISAVDISPEVVEACNQLLPGSTTLALNTASFLQEYPEQFDLIIMLHVLEHVPREELMLLLHAVRGALRPGGRLVVEVPNTLHPVTGAYNHYHDFTHVIGFTDQSLGFVLRNAGFRDVNIYGCKMPRATPRRFVQRTLQDIVELFAILRLRVYLPGQAVNLATTLGACASK